MIESGSCFTEDCENVAHQNTKQASKQRVKAVDAEMARDVLPKLRAGSLATLIVFWLIIWARPNEKSTQLVPLPSWEGEVRPQSQHLARTICIARQQTTALPTKQTRSHNPYV